MLFSNKKYLVLLILGLLVSSFVLFQTVFPSPAKVVDSQMSVSNDKEKLNQYLDLSKLPGTKEVTWLQQNPGKVSWAPGPSDYTILAVLSYEKPATSLIKEFQLKSQEVNVSEDFFGEWVPLAVKKSFTRTPGNYLHYDSQGYSAEPFLKSPVNSGWILFIDNYIVIFGATS